MPQRKESVDGLTEPARGPWLFFLLYLFCSVYKKSRNRIVFAIPAQSIVVVLLPSCRGERGYGCYI